MIKLEAVHKAMNDPWVLEIVHSLHFNWMLDPFDVDDPTVNPYIKKTFRFFSGSEATEEQVLAAETLFRVRVETGQAWSQ